jgi:sulfide:quinone oxidoreductase
MRTPSHQTHVVIAGGGVAAVEFALALHDLAGDRVRMTIVAPQPEFELRPLRTAEPFSRDHVRRHSLADLATQVGAELVADSVAKVHPEEHTVLLAGDRTLSYDALVLAVGAQHRTAIKKALTFTGDASTVPYNGLLADVDEGWARAVSFVVPPGTTWPLPLYELALMTAREAWGMGIDDVRLQIVSPEASPLALFGPQATAAVAELLERAGITFRGDTYVRETDDGRLELLPAGEHLDGGRIVALPIIEGRRLDGIPADERAFIPVDDRGRVPGLADVYAAGDGTTFPVKQGGIACQQADAIAELLAAAAGAPVDPQPFRPVLRGRLMTGRGAEYLEHAAHGGAGEGPPPELQLWDVTRKVDGRYLSPWLAELEGDATTAMSTAGREESVDVEVELPPTAYEAGSSAMRLDPYSPTRAR